MRRLPEVQCLQDAKLELLHALSNMDSLCRAETQMLRTKNAAWPQFWEITETEIYSNSICVVRSLLLLLLLC